MKQYYFNNMIVSVKLIYQYKSERYVYTDHFVYDTLFRKNKVKKFDNPVWIDKFDKQIYKTDEELIKNCKIEYSNREFSIINHELYFNPTVIITYANNEKAYKHFKTNDEVSEYYNNLIKENPGIECVEND